MSDTEKLKYRLIPIYLKYYFENHKHEPVKTKELLDYLSFKGVLIERKALSYYINALILYGMDIQATKGRNSAYYFQGYKEVDIYV